MGTKPPLWRRLELASDLFLNEVHDVIQTAFGWTDSHLHEFAVGKDYYDLTSEHYLCPFQVEEGVGGLGGGGSGGDGYGDLPVGGAAGG